MNTKFTEALLMGNHATRFLVYFISNNQFKLRAAIYLNTRKHNFTIAVLSSLLIAGFIDDQYLLTISRSSNKNIPRVLSKAYIHCIITITNRNRYALSQ